MLDSLFVLFVLLTLTIIIGMVTVNAYNHFYTNKLPIVLCRSHKPHVQCLLMGYGKLVGDDDFHIPIFRCPSCKSLYNENEEGANSCHTEFFDIEHMTMT